MQSRELFGLSYNFAVDTPLVNLQVENGSSAPGAEFLITENNLFLITEDGDQYITE